MFLETPTLHTAHSPYRQLDLQLAWRSVAARPFHIRLLERPDVSSHFAFPLIELITLWTIRLWSSKCIQRAYTKTLASASIRYIARFRFVSQNCCSCSCSCFCFNSPWRDFCLHRKINFIWLMYQMSFGIIKKINNGRGVVWSTRS